MADEGRNRIGILGGTFNPVHLGHLRMAEEALEILSLQRCVFIPAWVPPHKPNQKIVAFQHRWRMLERAVAAQPRFRLSDVERRLQGKSYTLITLKTLREEMGPSTALVLLVGADAFFEMHTWWQYREIFRIASVAVFDRPLPQPADPLAYLRRHLSDDYRREEKTSRYVSDRFLPVRFLETTRLDISSSRIRKKVAEGKSVRFLVPDAVLDYIKQKGLYVPESMNREHEGGQPFP
jgi:nicotinate-nucleotide adenylyltransferase